MNQSYTLVNAPNATLALDVCSECSCTKIMHACYFRLSSISMRVVYAECMNNYDREMSVVSFDLLVIDYSYFRLMK